VPPSRARIFLSAAHIVYIIRIIVILINISIILLPNEQNYAYRYVPLSHFLIGNKKKKKKFERLVSVYYSVAVLA